MPSSIPVPLAAYIADCLAPDTQTLVTSVLTTPSPWLSLRLLYATLYGVDDGPRHAQQTGHEVVFVSLLRPLSLWAEMGKKMGLDFASLLRNRRITYVDGLTGGIPSTAATASTIEADTRQLPTTRPRSITLKDIKDALDDVLRRPSISTSTRPTPSGHLSSSRSADGVFSPRIPPATASPFARSVGEKPLILIDGIDFLLASQPSVSPVELQSFLATLRTKCHGLMLTCQADSPLLHWSSTSGPGHETPLERNHAHFLTGLAHSARWVFQLRGLDTGSAKDVSGVIRVSRGGDRGMYDGVGVDDSPDRSREQDLADGEWLYQLQGDSAVRVWARGE
ncbi:hypothetical protein A1O3_07874 [Capronia epimyces CBS 606.96]|uniref:Elongator complex protein 6 n=1 Tax=Capronia epimyces CBS 606.96 TaxID=1182542 RepID=W9XQJ0_9EURO|nr:uncharacterized protein A1O3_07874 [Capronia epimyces CBS 606.96]EXJ79595.1 hypothetical protein A1O3_07874 [Capronia epimyces CBS 606.96]